MLNTIVLNLLEARVTLYAVAADGVTLGSALWSGQVAERLTVAERWIAVETRPTGSAYPIHHPLVPQYTVSIDRVWALPLSELNGFQPTNQTYVLEVIWTEEETQQWHRRRFYGVTISARSFEPRSIESEFVDGQEFTAQYFLVDSGVAGTTPAAVTATPSVVFWSGEDGYYALYNYTNGTEGTPGAYALASGVAATGATIAADGSAIQFGGSSGPVLATTAAGVTVGELHDGAPTDLPQLLFYSGAQLLAAVDTAGFWARGISDGTLPSGAAFTFAYQGQPVMVVTAAPALATAASWNALE